MRVVHVSTLLRGGAAAAMLGLHEALMRRGVESHVLVPSQAAGGENFSGLVTIEDPLSSVRMTVEQECIYANRTAGANSYYSLDVCGLDISGHPEIAAADVVHLHWVADFLSSYSLAGLARAGCRVVWTLHDMRPITGGCHFSGGCAGFEGECAFCPQLADSFDEAPARGLENLRMAAEWLGATYVSPSRWMEECVRRSSVAAGRVVRYIPYGVDGGVFAVGDRTEAREQLGLPGNVGVLLVTADVASETRKGFREAAAALKGCVGEDWVLAVAGGDASAFADTGWRVCDLGRIGGREKMAAAYRASDVFLCPSLEDNLPNTVLEAMACGCPVVGFPFGGMRDLVVDGITGRLAKTGTPGDLREVIVALMDDSEGRAAMGRAARERAMEVYHPDLQARDYEALYREMLDEEPGLIAPPENPGGSDLEAAPLLAAASVRNRRQLNELYACTAEQRRYIDSLEHELGR